jgi:SRSO17 transposase
MGYEFEVAGAARLDEYFGQIGADLKDWRKRESFAMYAQGLFGDGDRKSAEPMAARACGDPAETKRTQDKLLHFLGRSMWSDEQVRLTAARYAIDALSEREPVTTWIIDDTGFLKQGKHSVGVQRQYTGSAGKVTNCQLGVSLCIATASTQLPIDFELYLPRSWTDDEERCAKVRVPADVEFKTKTELALEMIERASKAEIPGEIVLADSAYGDCEHFRSTIRSLGFDYAVGIKRLTKLYYVDRNGRARGAPMTAAKLAEGRVKKSFRRLTWREGSQGKMSSRFAFVRVKTMHDDGVPLSERETQWLIIEWPEGDAGPSKFVLSTLPRRMTKKQIVRILKERWRTERMYQDLKGELGLDHFEGRSFPGWHHHISVVLCCAAFIIAEQARAFPPSAECVRKKRPLELAA